MILGLFKDKEKIQLSKDLAVTFLEAKRALMGLPKNKLNEKNIVSALGPMVNYPTVHSVTVEKLAININIKHKDLQLSVNPKFIDSGKDYENYELTLMGIYDYSGFSISYKTGETKPTVLLLDTSKFESGPHVIKPTKKSKILYEEFSQMTKFFNTKKI